MTLLYSQARDGLNKAPKESAAKYVARMLHEREVASLSSIYYLLNSQQRPYLRLEFANSWEATDFSQKHFAQGFVYSHLENKVVHYPYAIAINLFKRYDLTYCGQHTIEEALTFDARQMIAGSMQSSGNFNTRIYASAPATLPTSPSSPYVTQTPSSGRRRTLPDMPSVQTSSPVSVDSPAAAAPRPDTDIAATAYYANIFSAQAAPINVSHVPSVQTQPIWQPPPTGQRHNTSLGAQSMFAKYYQTFPRQSDSALDEPAASKNCCALL
ncbi:MAG: hypothetical protein K0S08_375 [Gammaproteobacteria bacterium]|jgi:hypothetical protein|nr:hypothetical protein [Gammaproteobacteria bacterium]